MWSSVAETALADAYQFAGGPVPERGLIMGRGAARMRTVRLGGPEVRKARKNVADAHEGGMCSCIMILLLHLCLTSDVGSRRL